MITEDYVSFETAELLKEKGFNEPCRLYYDKYHGCVPIFVEDSKLTEYGYKELVRNDQNSISDFIASAPSLYVVMKWLREVHKIFLNINFQECLCFTYRVVHNGVEEKFVVYSSTYEEAAEAAIKYCLKNLI